MGSRSAFTFDGIWHMQPEDDEYEILYLEFVMASWNLSGTPWNAYHSAIALRPVNADRRRPTLGSRSACRRLFTRGDGRN